MTETEQRSAKGGDTRNYLAELVSAGFTIVPFGSENNRESYGFVDNYVTEYKIHPCGDLKTKIGSYLKNSDKERTDPNYPRFTIIYGTTEPSIREATRLKTTLERIGATFSEDPSKEERQAMITDLAEKLIALKNSVGEKL